MTTSPHEATAEAPRDVDGKAMMLSFALTGVLDIGVAVAAYQLARAAGASVQVAFLAAGVGPLSMVGLQRVRTGRFGGLSVVILGYLVISAAIALVVPGDDPRILLVKDSLVTGVFGVACLASLLLPKPLMFFFGVKFATDGTRDGVAHWYGLWRYPDFRGSQYLINNMWGLAFIGEAAVRILVAYRVASFDLANLICTILPFAVLAVLVVATITIGRRVRAAAAARTSATRGGPGPTTTPRRGPDGR